MIGDKSIARSVMPPISDSLTVRVGSPARTALRIPTVRRAGSKALAPTESRGPCFSMYGRPAVALNHVLVVYEPGAADRGGRNHGIGRRQLGLAR
jgi:hypothetical protein